MSENSKHTFSTMIDAMGPIYVQYATWMKMQKLEKEIQTMQKSLNSSNFMVVCFFSFFVISFFFKERKKKLIKK